MISTTIKSFIQADLASVWHSVTSLYDYSWRSDIKDIEVSDERHFKEISNDIHPLWIMRTFPGSGQDISGRLKMGQK